MRDTGDAVPDAGNVSLQYGVLQSGRIDYSGDVDYFRLATEAGQSVQARFDEGMLTVEVKYSLKGTGEARSETFERRTG